MKKTIAFIAAAAAAAIGLTGCAEDPASTETLHVYMPDGAPAVALAKFMSEGYDGADFTVVPNAAKVTIAQHVAKGDADFAILPVNAAATLYNSGVQIVMLSVNTHGNLYVIGSGDAITPSGLVGKKLGVIGQANVPEHALKMLLSANDIDYAENSIPTAESGKVSITYVGGGTELAPQLAQSRIDYGFLAEPAATTISTNLSSKGINIVMDIQEQWRAAYGGDFPQACLVVKKSLTETKKKYVDDFVSALAEADDWAENNPTAAVEAVKAHMADGAASSLAALSADVVRRCNIKTVSAQDSKQACQTYFSKLLDMSTALGSPISKAPDDGFYYKAQ